MARYVPNLAFESVLTSLLSLARTRRSASRTPAETMAGRLTAYVRRRENGRRRAEGRDTRARARARPSSRERRRGKRKREGGEWRNRTYRSELYTHPLGSTRLSRPPRFTPVCSVIRHPAAALLPGPSQRCAPFPPCPFPRFFGVRVAGSRTSRTCRRSADALDRAPARGEDARTRSSRVQGKTRRAFRRRRGKMAWRDTPSGCGNADARNAHLDAILNRTADGHTARRMQPVGQEETERTSVAERATCVRDTASARLAGALGKKVHGRRRFYASTVQPNGLERGRSNAAGAFHDFEVAEVELLMVRACRAGTRCMCVCALLRI